MKTTKVKLCGNRSLVDLKTTTASTGDYIGVIFSASKRQVNPFQLAEWIEKYPLQDNQQLVGVFVNEDISTILNVLDNVNLDVIQLHGTETVPYILSLREQVDIPIWKVIHHQRQGLQLMQTYSGVVDGYVVDSKVQGAWGGSGITFDWEAVPSYLKEAQQQGVPCFIAGGITPQNVTQLLQYEPFGIDVSSGIEAQDQKDDEKVASLLEEIHREVDVR
ncbi:phosphoribosylanthranilate isomerase [Cytobacillus sp. Hm23]